LFSFSFSSFLSFFSYPWTAFRGDNWARQHMHNVPYCSTYHGVGSLGCILE
jgi:hypothetical protein